MYDMGALLKHFCKALLMSLLCINFCGNLKKKKKKSTFWSKKRTKSGARRVNTVYFRAVQDQDGGVVRNYHL